MYGRGQRKVTEVDGRLHYQVSSTPSSTVMDDYDNYGDGDVTGRIQNGRTPDVGFSYNASSSSLWKKKKTQGVHAADLTPMSLLYDICQKRGGIIEFPSENQVMCSVQGRHLFKCMIRCSTFDGKVFEGTGVASNKKEAKHSAAKTIISQIDPESEFRLAPQYCQPSNGGNHSATHADHLNDDYMTNAVLAVSPTINGRHREPTDAYHSVVSSSNEAVKGVDSVTTNYVASQGAAGVNVTSTEDGQLTIRVKLPPTKSRQQNSSMSEVIHSVLNWEGPKIARLQGKSVHAVREIKSPTDVVDQICKEQNLKVEYFCVEGKKEDGIDNEYTCILDVSSRSTDDQIEQPTVHFTEFGIGDDYASAQRVAALNFLIMIRMILNAA